MREVRWERMFPDELEAAYEAFPTAYLSYGLCEPHGPINALGNDGIRAHETCILAARRHGGIVCPPEYWHCHEIGGYAVWGHNQIGNQRTWLTAVPPWMFLKNMCYHIRAMDALRFHATIIFSGHSGPHRKDVPVIIETMQRHVDTRIDWFVSSGTDTVHFQDGDGTGGHAGRGETSQLWSVAPDCVDLSRLPPPDAERPLFAMGQYNDRASRRVGDAMTEDVIERLGARAKELMAEYSPSREKPLTFGDVEQMWTDEIQPKLKDFASLQQPEECPPEDSQWYANHHIPNL